MRASTSLVSSVETPTDTPVLEAQINDLLDGFHHAAATADGTDYFDRFAPDGIFMGTDASERWNVAEFRAYAKHSFAQGRGWTYRKLERHIMLDATGQVGWFDEILVNDSLGRCRGTGIVTRHNNGWKLNHYSLTLLIPNSVADEVGALTQSVDRKAAQSEHVQSETAQSQADQYRAEGQQQE
ncbi:MAG: hypothetical protein ACJATP_000205 [Candidatus Azotimanducaceae bacterium]|jgi:hypothetical protein